VKGGLDIGYCARPGQVDVRLSAFGDQGATLVSEADQIVRKQLGLHIFGEGSEELETIVVRLLTERRQTLALAESCTGGFIAHALRNLPGASAVVWGGLVTYSNESKQKFLGVGFETLQEHGAVSE